MKKILPMLLFLFLLYFAIQFLFISKSNGFTNTYEITNGDHTYSVKEVYTANTTNEHDNYYLEITNDNYTYYYQTYLNLNKANHIVKTVEQYDNCILPVFKDNQFYYDITCYVDGVQKYYHDLKGTQAGLDTYAKSDELKALGYDYNGWSDTSEVKTYDRLASYYEANALDQYAFAVKGYRGLYTMNKDNLTDLYLVNIFSGDVYDAFLGGFVNQYYLTPDYSDNTSFNKIYKINLNNNEKTTINYSSNISYNSYIQGSYQGALYLFDRTSLKQYEINPQTNTITEVGNVDTKILLYQNGELTRVSAYTANNTDLYFDQAYESLATAYARSDKVGNALSGFIYYYQRQGSSYEVYRANVQNSEVLTYVFTTTNINHIRYIDDYVFYIDGDTIKYYNDQTGVKALYKNNELRFNNAIDFYVN